MPNFASPDAFATFARTVRRERRFAHTRECTEFLEGVKACALERRIEVPRAVELCRAQIGREWEEQIIWQGEREGEEVREEVEVPYGVKRMSPDPERVTEGRLNPRGIAVLYLSREPETAIAEVRPWVGAAVSVGVFQVLRDCTLVNCSEPGGRGLHLVLDAKGERVPPPPEEWNALVWEGISYAFARPTDPPDSSLTYAPTQILAEILREGGYDGILYQSALRAEGKNIALFDPSLARLVSCRLHEVHKVEYSSSDTGRGYALRPLLTTRPWIVNSGGTKLSSRGLGSTRPHSTRSRAARSRRS